jgi:hypothetical protein
MLPLLAHGLEISLHAVDSHRNAVDQENDLECLASTGVSTPVLAKHRKSFKLIDTPAVGLTRIQNFEPMQLSSKCIKWRLFVV